MRYSDLLRYYSDEYTPPTIERGDKTQPTPQTSYEEMPETNYVEQTAKNDEVFIPFQKKEKELEYKPSSIEMTKGMSRAEFIKKNYNTFEKKYREAGLDPVVAMAQAILESGINRGGGEGSGSSLALKHHNLFGIKARKGEQSTNMATSEYKNNVKYGENADFAVNNSFDDSLTHHINFLKKYDRYSKLFNNNNRENVINVLAQSGYATDPEYGNLLRQIINKDILPNIKK